MVDKKELLNDAVEIIHKQRIANKVLKHIEKVLSKHRYPRLELADSDYFDLKVAVEELIEAGVEIKEFLGSGFRVVFSAIYQGKPVVIKFAPLEIDLRSNIRENRIYAKAELNNDEGSFAKIYLITENNRALVQEYCTDFMILDDYKKPKDKWIERYLEDIDIDLSREERLKAIRKKVSELRSDSNYNPNLDLEFKYRIYECQMGKNSKGKWVYVDYDK